MLRRYMFVLLILSLMFKVNRMYITTLVVKYIRVHQIFLTNLVCYNKMVRTLLYILYWDFVQGCILNVGVNGNGFFASIEDSFVPEFMFL